MSLIKTLEQRANKLREEALKLALELRKEDLTEERRTEIREQLRKAKTDVENAREELQIVRDMEPTPVAQARRDLNPGGGSPQASSPDLRSPTVEEIRERAQLGLYLNQGRTLSDEQIERAARTWPVEELFGRMQMDGARPSLNVVSADERSAWHAHQAVLTRALANPYNTTGATQGAEFVPTNIEQSIVGARKHDGPLAGDDLVSVFRIDYFGNLDVPRVTGAAEATPIAEGTDTDGNRLATGNVSFNPHKFHYAVPANSEMLMGWVNFEEFITGEAGRGFGRAYNSQRTVGNGTGRNMRGFTDAGADGTVRAVVGTADTIVKTDISAMYKLLDYGHFNRPGTRVMMHPSTELDLFDLADADGSIRISQVTGQLLLPRNVPYELNSAMAVKGAAGRRVMAVGDFGRYGVFYAAGMRVYTEYLSRSDQYLMTWYQWTDGQRIDGDAFRFLDDKA